MQKLPLDRQVLVADTIRPYVYAHAGGSDVEVYNAYTGQKVATLSNVGAALGAMAVSPDGSLLYAADTANRAVKRVNLDTGLAVDSWTLSAATTLYDTALVVRTNGVEVLVMGDGGAYAAGRRLGTVGGGESHAATSDGRMLVWQNRGLSPASAGALSLDYSEVNGGTLMASDAQGAPWFYNGSSNGRDIAVSPDGTRVYTATGAPYRCTVLAGSDMSLIGSLPGGDAYPNNVEVTSDGRVICGISGRYSSSDFWVHSATGALIQGYKVAGYAREIKARQMVVTPDGLIVATLTDDPVLAFVAIGR
jgi:WD40 repeat protein